nr:C4-dicarboxylate ABC transporter [Candidatus Pantoea persica]
MKATQPVRDQFGGKYQDLMMRSLTSNNLSRLAFCAAFLW